MKRAYVMVTPEFLGSICKPTDGFNISIESDVPIDAKFISAKYDAYRDCFMILFEHGSFKDIPEGLAYPQIKRIEITTERR